MRESWWGRQLQREDLIATLEQGRRVEVELFQEKHRGLRTMGELLKARMFGATDWAINLRKRMTKFQGGGTPAGADKLGRSCLPESHVQGGGGSHPQIGSDRTVRSRSPEPSQEGGAESPPRSESGRAIEAAAHLRSHRLPEPHSWPCDDPFCQPCEDAVKRLLRDVGVIPRKRGAKP